MKRIDKLKRQLNLLGKLKTFRNISIYYLLLISVTGCGGNILELGNPNLNYSDVLKCVKMTEEEIQFISNQTLDLILYNNELICGDE